MPEIEFDTAAEPFCAASSDAFATRADSSADEDTFFIEFGHVKNRRVGILDFGRLASVAASSSLDVDCAAFEALVTRRRHR
jgi:hypothetical protein